MVYKFVDMISDIAVEIKTSSPEELFIEGALALEEIMVDLDFETDMMKTIKLSAESLDLLFFDWLSELIFIKDTNRLVFNKFSIELNGTQLNATIYGTKIENTKEQKADVKAITMHKFKVDKTNDGWYAFVVFDV